MGAHSGSLLTVLQSHEAMDEINTLVAAASNGRHQNHRPGRGPKRRNPSDTARAMACCWLATRTSSVFFRLGHDGLNLNDFKCGLQFFLLK